MVCTWRGLGITPVFAAGNGGPAAGSQYAPASYPESLGVGATDEQRRVAAFSSRGPLTWEDRDGDGDPPAGTVIHGPALVAPGVTVGSSTPGGGYGSASGTSVSAPHASGTAALMLEANPSLSPAGVMGLMQATATPVEPSRDPAGGAGQVDALAAVAAALGIDPPRVPFGRLSPAGVPAPECLRRERAAVGPSPRPGRVRLTATQLRINQRISQAAVRRSNRLAGCLGVADRVRTGGTGTRRTGVRLTAAQVRINQRIAQAAVRRLNALRAEVTS